jgi:flagellar basal body rod protein FlgG
MAFLIASAATRGWVRELALEMQCSAFDREPDFALTTSLYAVAVSKDGRSKYTRDDNLG